MRYNAKLTGISPLILHNGAAGLDTRSPAKLEIAEISKKRGSNRTEADDARLVELECLNGLYLDESMRPTVPVAMLRAAIEAAARKTRQGGNVREGLLVESAALTYDAERYGETLDEIVKAAQFTVPVVVQRARVLRTRPKFDPPWSILAFIDCDDELVDERMLASWLAISGHRIGIGDWRPQCSGNYGRFDVESLTQI